MRRPFPVAFALAYLVSFHAQAEILIGAAGPMTGKLTWIGEQLQRGAERRSWPNSSSAAGSSFRLRGKT